MSVAKQDRTCCRGNCRTYEGTPIHRTLLLNPHYCGHVCVERIQPRSTLFSVARLDQHEPAEPVNRNESSWALGPPTQHEHQLPFAGRGSGNVALSWYERVRNESDVGAFGTPHCRVRARRAESCVEGSSSGSRPHFWQEAA